MHAFELSKTNRLILARAFQHNPRVDYSIECVIEGQMGQAFVDDLACPTAFCIRMGPFWYFAGDVTGEGGEALLRNFPPFSLLMPSPPDWMDAARCWLGERLVAFPRYSFSADGLSLERLSALLDSSPLRDTILPLNERLIAQLAAQPDPYFEMTDFDSPQDFLARSYGFCAQDDSGDLMGVAYGSLVCSRGVEVSIFVEGRYRQRGLATALACRLLIECLQRGGRPNWDAANPESCKLALKLGYRAAGGYDAYYYRAG